MGNEKGFLYLDLSQVMEKFAEVGDDLRKRLDAEAKSLAIQTDSKVREWASQRLHTRLPQFLENLEWEQLDNGTYAVTIHKEARWIEDGMEPHNMLEDLLGSPKAKTVKEGPNRGSKYIIVPFKHDKGKTQRTPQQTQLLKAIKQELRSQKVPYKGVERNPDGSPKFGLLHKFDIAKPKQQKRVRPGQQGPSGQYFGKNGPTQGQEGPGGRPFLWGVRVYQHPKKNKKGDVMMGADGHPKTERSIFTFRTASSAQQGQWDHPGLTAMHFLEDAYQWAQNEWDSKIAPEILRSMELE